MTREALDVLASRARERTTLYVATHDQLVGLGDDDARVNRACQDPHMYEAREILLNILVNESAALSGTEAITTAREDAASLAVLIPRYIHAARQYAATRGFGPGGGSVGTLPWVPSPPDAADGQLATYLADAAASIDTRIEHLVEAVVRDRPLWARSLGDPPRKAEQYAMWRQQIKIIAAYRDQQGIAINDPRHILGPYLDPDHSACVARGNAAQAVRTARGLAEIEPSPAPLVDARSCLVSDAHRSRTGAAESSYGKSESRRSQQQARPTLLDPSRGLQRDVSHHGAGPRPRA